MNSPISFFIVTQIIHVLQSVQFIDKVSTDIARRAVPLLYKAVSINTHGWVMTDQVAVSYR